jgi:hypothetical protein
MLLKIINVPPSSSYLRIDSGRGYDFLWEAKHQGFIYAPKTQAEIEEIYQALASYGNPWVVVPVLDGVTSAPASAAPASVSPDEREAQAAFVAKLQGDIDSASKQIAKLRAESKDKDETIAMLRADLSAQQTKAVAAPTPAKGKPGRKPKAAPFGTADATPAPADDLPADV